MPVLLICAGSPAGAADSDSLAEGARLEAAGDTAAAARFYREWLRANPSDPRAEAAFFSAYRLETALPELFELASLPGLGPQPLLALARLAEMAGRAEEARGLYRRAVDAGAGLQAVVGWLALSLSMSDAAAVQQGLGLLRALDPSWADTIEGLSDLAAGRLEQAALKLGRIPARTADPRAALAAAWGLAECARLSGNPAALAAARSEIESRFPGSPEAALAAGLVARAASPGQFVAQAPAQAFAEPVLPGAQSSGDTEPAVSDTGVQAPSDPRFAVQAGSFQVRENADYLAADLSRKGFSALVRGETREGRQVFKVFAGVGLARAAAEALSLELSKAGFAGFVISEVR